MNNERTELDLYWERAKNAWDCKGKSEDETLLCLLEDIQKSPWFDSDSEWLCLKGYIYYCLASRKEALNAFRHALEFDQTNSFASLYVGHCLFDDGQIAEAFAHFTQMNDNTLSSVLKLKKSEMVLCCRVHLDGVSVVDKEIRHHLNECILVDEFPENLARSLSKVKSSIAHWITSGLDENSYYYICMERYKRDEYRK